MNFNTLYETLSFLKEENEKLNSTRPIRIMTLFSGMGAPEIALKQLDIPYEIVLACEYDSVAKQVYKGLHEKHNHYVNDVYNILKIFKKNPDATQDISHLNEKYKTEQPINEISDIDLLVAGFPCQAFSGQGKGLGFNSRKIKPVVPVNNTFKSAIVDYKHDIKSEIPNTGGSLVRYYLTDKVLDRARKNDSVKAYYNDCIAKGTKPYIEILPDSDGTLSLETLRIVKTIRPKVVILENVADFAGAKMTNDEQAEQLKIATESTNLKLLDNLNPTNVKSYGLSGKVSDYDPENKDGKGGFINLLKNILKAFNYKFYPMFLDPTSYTKETIIRRPRVYMIAIKNDLATIFEKNKNTDDVEKLFDIDKKILNNKSDKEYGNRFRNIVDRICEGGTSYINPLNDNKFIINIAERYGIKQILEKINEYINDYKIKDKSIDDYINENITKIKNSNYISNMPVILNASNNDNAKNKILKWIDDYGDDYIKTSQRFNNYKHSKSDNKNYTNSSMFTNLKRVNSQATQDDLNMIKKEIFIKVLQEYLAQSYAKDASYIPTVLKNSNIPSSAYNVNGKGYIGAAKLIILINSKGEIFYGYLSPEDIAELMGIDKEHFNILKSIKIKNKRSKSGRTITVNQIINRIGNSMDVNVLKKLFDILIKSGIFK